jgi:hypothetical protein
VTDYIPIGLRQAAIALATEREYPRAAARLNLTLAEMQDRICTLESLLYPYL